MTKQTLRQRVADQSERIRELEGRLRALELRLSEHCEDKTRHPEVVRGQERARPMLDPDDGASPGSGTVTTSGQCAEWYTEPIAGIADNCEVQPVDADRVDVVLEHSDEPKPADGYYSLILFSRGEERLVIGAMLLIPEASTVETRMVADVSRVARAFGVTEHHVREVQRYAAAAIERDVHNGANVCAARALWCAEARIGDARWCRVVDGPQETLRDILEAALCH
jgi:hypothetical protein